MQLDGPLDSNSLAALGVEALRLLCSGSIATLASRFGYAVAYGREPAAAIQEDLNRYLGGLRATSLVAPDNGETPKVRYFKSNSIGLLASIDCLAKTNTGSQLLVTLVVAGTRQAKHITLEDIYPLDGVSDE